MSETLSETIERVKEAADLKRWCEDHLERKGRTFVCPACGSGKGEHGTPAFSIKGNRWKCFSCGRGGDVIDLQGIVSGNDNMRENVEAVAEWAGVDIEDRRVGKPGAGGSSSYGWEDTVAADNGTGKPAEKRVEDQVEDFSEGRSKVEEYLEKCCLSLTAFKEEDASFQWLDQRAGAYLESRGVTPVKAARAGFGFDPNAPGGERRGEDGQLVACDRGRITIPWTSGVTATSGGAWYYTARSLDPRVTKDKYLKPSGKKVGGQPSISDEALERDVLFVVEGLMDAYGVLWALDSASVDDSASVVPLGGVGNAGATATAIADRHYQGTAVLMLDNDERGVEAAGRMSSILEDRGVEVVSWEWGESDHDPADMWRDCQETFSKGVGEWARGHAHELYVEKQHAEARAEMEAYLTDPLDVLESLYSLDGAVDPIPTGFPELDRILGGGLQPSSLHVIGATSSSGKTTFTLQVADFIAQSGHPVLFVSIEQRPDELVSKSIARAAAMHTGIMYGRDALEATDMRNREARGWWTLEQQSEFTKAANWYTANVRPRMRYLYPNGKKATVSQIERMADLMTAEFGESPCIFLDYLQLLAAPEGSKGADARLAVDDNMTALRAMAGRLKTPVWVVSSVGRAAYYGTVDMGSYKESSGVEFSSDVALGLQPRDMAEAVEGGRTEAQQRTKGKERETSERENDVRNVELTVLKNRFGRVRPRHGFPFVYYCPVDLFSPVKED